MKLWMRVMVLPVAMLVAAGCEEKPQVPPELLSKPAEPRAGGIPRPTTQELISGPRSRTVLSPLPLTMDLPPSWGRESLNDIPTPANLLQGYTPSGEVQIQLATRPPMKQAQLDALLVGAKKEMEKDPQQKVELRTQGKMKILERQSVGKPRPLTVYDSNMQPKTTEESIFNWSVLALLPRDDGYQAYELIFIGLTKSQYDKDRAFLEGILRTLEAGGEGATTMPAAPASAP